MTTKTEQIMEPAQARERLGRLKGWTLAGSGKAIRQELSMQDFTAAVDLMKAIAPLANELDHHPDLQLTGYRKLVIELSTHSAGGLTEKDFTLAARIDALPKKLKA